MGKYGEQKAHRLAETFLECNSAALRTKDVTSTEQTAEECEDIRPTTV